MALIPLGLDRKWESVYKNHQYLINSEKIYFNTMKLANKHHKLLDRESFVEYYKTILDDIELESHPIDMFIPNDNMEEELESEDGHTPQIIVVSRKTPEYKRIKKRINLEDLYATIPETHPVHMELKANPGKLDIVVDDIVLYWAVYKFIEMIEAIRLKDISVMKDIIEYTVENIDVKKWKDFLSTTRRIKPAKTEKWMNPDNYFGPDMDHTVNFYKVESVDNQAIVIDVEDLLLRMCSNIVFNSDIYIIIAVYLILTFSKVDIKAGNFDNSPCATYVRDVISQL